MQNSHILKLAASMPSRSTCTTAWARNSASRRAPGAIDASCEFTKAMFSALHEAVEHPDMTEALGKVLSTRVVDVEFQIDVDRGVGLPPCHTTGCGSAAGVPRAFEPYVTKTNPVQSNAT